MKIVILPLSLILSSALAFKELGTGIDLADNPFAGPEKEVMPEDPEWVPDVIGFSPKPDGLAARPQCSSYWSGTAPICRGGKCRPGYHPTISSTRGGGRRCITGKKVLCECNTVTACQDYWAGKGPFCGKPKCADGYRELFKSNSGDGGLCLRGHKKYCQCISGGTIPICVPQVPIKTQCFGFLMVCNNGCKTFGCGICLGWKGAKATLESSGQSSCPGILPTHSTVNPLAGCIRKR